MDISIAPHVAHAAPLCKPVVHTVLVGVTYMSALYCSLASAAIAGGLAWYIRGRGLAGVEIDISNIKTDITNLKNKIDPSAPAPVTVAA